MMLRSNSATRIQGRALVEDGEDARPEAPPFEQSMRQLEGSVRKAAIDIERIALTGARSRLKSYQSTR
jgi:hypothetical protein